MRAYASPKPQAESDADVVVYVIAEVVKPEDSEAVGATPPGARCWRC